MSKKDVIMLCSCGKQCEHKQFVQFDYWYCPKCRIEVKTSALPFGMAALSGEHVTTCCCGEKVGELNQHLPKDPKDRREYMISWAAMYTGCKDCKTDRTQFKRTLNIWSPTWNTQEEIRLHIKGRGWV